MLLRSNQNEDLAGNWTLLDERLSQSSSTCGDDGYVVLAFASSLVGQQFPIDVMTDPGLDGELQVSSCFG